MLKTAANPGGLPIETFDGMRAAVLADRSIVVCNVSPGAAFLINAPFAPGEVWDRLPREMQEQILEKLFVQAGRIERVAAPPVGERRWRSPDPAPISRGSDR